MQSGFSDNLDKAPMSHPKRPDYPTVETIFNIYFYMHTHFPSSYFHIYNISLNGDIQVAACCYCRWMLCNAQNQLSFYCEKHTRKERAAFRIQKKNI